MSCYISSNANRLYAGLEAAYGQVPAITAANRLPAVKLSAKQQQDASERKDKTGSRTFAGNPAGIRRRTSFELKTYLTGWSGAGEPGYGPLFQAALGATPMHFGGGVLSAGSTERELTFVAPHGLTPGQAITHGGEMRFVEAVVSATTVELSAPLSVVPAAGAQIGPTVTYAPATALPSVSVFDYWTPATAVQRIVRGAAVDRLQIQVNGDFHEFEFRGGAQDLVDSAAFSSGMGSLSVFPEEPPSAAFDSSIVPGHLGQAWLGSGPDRFYTITDASFVVDNDLDLRAREFGSALPRCIAPGRRSVAASFDLYEQDDLATRALYVAARQQAPLPVMFQLGQAKGQLCGVFMKRVIPEVPEFDDSERRLQWRFRDSKAQGTIDDEVAIAFG